MKKTITLVQLVKREGGKFPAYLWIVRAGIDIQPTTFYRWLAGIGPTPSYQRELEGIGIKG